VNRGENVLICVTSAHRSRAGNASRNGGSIGGIVESVRPEQHDRQIAAPPVPAAVMSQPPFGERHARKAGENGPQRNRRRPRREGARQQIQEDDPDEHAGSEAHERLPPGRDPALGNQAARDTGEPLEEDGHRDVKPDHVVLLLGMI
jgi:hypothetical protein